MRKPTLRRELGLRDLTLFAIACIISTRWLPAAAHAGAGSVTLWLVATVLLVIPLAIAVAALIVKHPGAGGLYVWTRNDFGPWHGFVAFWVYWIGIAFWFPSAAMFYMSVGLEAVSPAGAHWGENRAALLAVSLAAIWLALGTNLVGLRIGKWLENAGAVAAWSLGALLVVAAAVAWMRRGPATPMHFLPRWNWGTVTFWSNIAYAMTGLELAGMMGDEIRDPERNLPRAGWMASGVITLFYIAATISLLVLLPASEISELNGLAQASVAAATITGLAWLAPLMALLVMASAVGQLGAMGTSVSRLPFAVSADHLLPPSFARVHPQWGTPHVATMVLGAVASFLLIALQLGDTLRAAYQELVSLMVITGFLAFGYIFASAWKAGKRVSALAGWTVTLLSIVCATVPPDEVTNVWLFEGKLAAGTLLVIGSGWWIYRRYRRHA